MKPRIFIGSSTEGKPIADAIHSELQSEAECTVWTHGVFGLSEAYTETLKRQVDNSEFGIFVFSPDDAVTMRADLFSAPRDNVVYELGLFSGALGRERCFFVTPAFFVTPPSFITPAATSIHLPTDLLGMTAGEYETGRRDGNLQAAVGPFCTKVRNKIREMTLGVDILRPKNNAELQIGWQTLTCQCTGKPGNDVFLFTHKGDRWWPRRERLEQITGFYPGRYLDDLYEGKTRFDIPGRETTDNLYEVKMHFDTRGRETVLVVKATDIGILWIKSYHDMTDTIKQYPPMITGELRGRLSH
jgi:hypothetical protein